jgi:hypothetical protein
MEQITQKLKVANQQQGVDRSDLSAMFISRWWCVDKIFGGLRRLCNWVDVLRGVAGTPN